MADRHSEYLRGYSIGVGGVVVRDNKVLLVRRASEPRSGDWALPGGYIERDETIDTAIVREVLEEAGIHAEVEGLIGVLHRWNGDENGVYLMFLMRAASGEPNGDGGEVSEARFFSLEDLDSLPQLQWLSQLITIPVLQGREAMLPRCIIPEGELNSQTTLFAR